MTFNSGMKRTRLESPRGQLLAGSPPQTMLATLVDKRPSLARAMTWRFFSAPKKVRMSFSHSTWWWCFSAKSSPGGSWVFFQHLFLIGSFMSFTLFFIVRVLQTSSQERHKIKKIHGVFFRRFVVIKNPGNLYKVTGDLFPPKGNKALPIAQMVGFIVP